MTLIRYAFRYNQSITHANDFVQNAGIENIIFHWREYRHYKQYNVHSFT